MTTTTPPAAESGIKYRTVDERCAACVVYGGEESKCVSGEWERHIGAKTGRVCPRVDLWPENRPEADLVEFVLGGERLQALAGLRAETVAEVYGLTGEEMHDVLSRVAAVLGSPEVSAIINPAVERG